LLSSHGRACAAVLVVSVALAARGGDSAGAHQAGLAGERPSGPTVDFTAVQPDGTPVSDLQASEVEIRINGRLRALRSLRRIATAPLPVAPGAAPGLPAPFGTNDTVAVGRTIALVFDEESFVPGREQLLRRAVEGLVEQLTSADQAMVVALPFAGVKVPLTSDTRRIRLAMGMLAGQGVRNESGSDLACRTRRFLDAFDEFLLGQAGRSSPLTVVLFTAGLAAPRRDAPMALGPGMCELLVDHFEQVTVTAGAARANLFVVQPDDVGMAGERWRESIAGVGSLGSNNPLEGIEHIVGVTGAVRLPLDASGTAALLRVARESSAYFEAELVPERVEAISRSRSLDVRVSRRGVTVRARPAITFAESRRGDGTPRLALSDLLLSRAAGTDLPLRTAGFTVLQPDGRLRIGVVVELAEPGTSLASAGAALAEADGRIVAQWFAGDPLDRPLLGAMIAPPGTYRLRVVAIDSTGRIGAAEDIVNVGLTPVGPLSLGSLVLGLSRDGGVAPRLQFGGEPTAIASFDIYGGAAGMPISAALEIARDPGGAAIASLPLTLARAGQSRVVATGAVPIGALPPGDYVVRGIIRLEDGTTGRVSRTLRKTAR
jgi:hypothetical protein